MIKLRFYGYCVGIPSSRRIGQKTDEDVALRILTCDTHRYHSRIADFRKPLSPEISRLLVQVLEICKESGLVMLGHVALNGTTIKANASKHKAMIPMRFHTSNTESPVHWRSWQIASATDGGA